MTSSNKVLLGVFGALAAGVVIGLLIAPEKGSDMRKKIGKTVGDWSDSLGNVFTRGKEAAEDVVKNVKEKARSMAEERTGNTKENYS